MERKARSEFLIKVNLSVDSEEYLSIERPAGRSLPRSGQTGVCKTMHPISMQFSQRDSAFRLPGDNRLGLIRERVGTAACSTYYVRCLGWS